MKLRFDQYQKQKKAYDSETKEYEMNQRCEDKLVSILNNHQIESMQSALTNPIAINPSVDLFDDAVPLITFDMIKNNQRLILNSEAKAFIRVRSVGPYMSWGRLAYHDIPERKDSVLRKLFDIISNPVQPRFFTDMPLPPAGYTSYCVSADDENNDTQSPMNTGCTDETIMDTNNWW